MNRSLKCILTVILIASVLCGALAPAVSAGFVVQTTTPSGLKPSSCYSAPKYPYVMYKISFSESGLVRNNSTGEQVDGPPYTVYFSDLTIAPVEGQTIASRYWNFGDGSTSTEKDPVHTYASPGNYSVLLSVTTICGSQYTSKRAFSLKVYCTYPSPSFTSDVYEGMAPLTVHITDTSTHAPPGVTTWTYGYDATHFSHDRNPVFTFTEPGTYIITQTVTKSCVAPELHGTLVPSAVIRVNPAVGYVHAMPFSTYSSVTTTPTVTAFGQRLTGNPTETTPAPGSASPGAMSFSTPPATAATPSPQIRPAAGTPQGAPAAPGTGTLSVTTDPAGASVWVDDVKWGVSPAAIPGITAGTHTLRLEKAGYQGLSVPVTVTEGNTAEYSLALEPLSGSSSPWMLPLIAGAIVAVILVGAGAYFFNKKKKAP